LTLGAAGANQIASNPWINLFIAALFVYFAFSLFGQYEIQLPSSLRQFSVQQEDRGGVMGILFMALTFTLTSFTCTVQFVGLLLVAASQGEYFWPVLGMITFSTAFASPFFFLALFPQYLAKLPKSGGWLNSVKVTMGFLELGAAMKFLSNSDLVWQWGIFTKQVVLAVWVIISIMMGLYLLGKIKLPHDSDIDFISVPRLVLSIVFISFGLYLSGGLFGRPIHGLIDSYLPPVIGAAQNNDDGSTQEHFVWINDLQDGLSEANKENKPLFIDFTGYTCTNCRWMETNIFVEPEVQSLFDEFVLVQLFTDGGPNYRENQKMEIERFGTSALPFYVVLSPENEELSRFHGMDPDVNKFIGFLEDSLNGHKAKGI
jgi:thiol:disulfide interchange protein DsbD